MQRRDLLKMISIGPFSRLPSDHLQKAVANLEAAARITYGDIKFEVSVDDDERMPMLITVRRA